MLRGKIQSSLMYGMALIIILYLEIILLEFYYLKFSNAGGYNSLLQGEPIAFAHNFAIEVCIAVFFAILGSGIALAATSFFDEPQSTRCVVYRRVASFFISSWMLLGFAWLVDVIALGT